MHVFTYLSPKYQALMNPTNNYNVEEAGMIAGIALGKLAPGLTATLSKLEFGQGSQVNIPIAVLIWLMIYPMVAVAHWPGQSPISASRPSSRRANSAKKPRCSWQ